jgi:quinoprotein glucose dehydrogenase
MRAEGIFTPPATRGTVLFPGDIGGCNWSGGSFDPVSQTLFVNTNRIATLITLIPRDKFEEVKRANPGVEISAQAGAPYGVRRDWLYGHGYIPGTKPPWGALTAIDLGSGKRVWEVPLGVTPAVSAWPNAGDFGSLNLGGSFVTTSGLLFIAAAQDDTLRAFDTKTGKVLWNAKLPAGGNAAPMTYMTRSGKQFVVICAGGHHGLRTTPGDYVVACALP